MCSQHPIIAFEVAIAHQDEMLHQANSQRLMGVAESGHRRVLGGVMQFAGQRLVRLGERLQTTRRRPNGGELAAAAGALRISR
jgi:hypothetical protein